MILESSSQNLEFQGHSHHRNRARTGRASAPAVWRPARWATAGSPAIRSTQLTATRSASSGATDWPARAPKCRRPALFQAEGGHLFDRQERSTGRQAERAVTIVLAASDCPAGEADLQTCALSIRSACAALRARQVDREFGRTADGIVSSLGASFCRIICKGSVQLGSSGLARQFCRERKLGNSLIGCS